MASTAFQTEARVEYVIGVLVLLLRVAFGGWHGDDYFALASIFMRPERHLHTMRAASPPFLSLGKRR